MQHARTSSLMLNLKRGAAAATAALVTVAAPFNASAHVLPGSVLEKHKGFINSMSRINADGSKGTSCCHEKDGQGGLEEKKTVRPDGTIKYSVKIVNDEEGRPLAHPIWQDIPDIAVLRYKDAVEHCKVLRRDEPLSEDAATCTMPTTNALWTNPIAHDAEPDSFTIWCYLPKPPKF